MSNYFFTLFIRILVAVSGFFVFIVSSKLFGAEGRGIISYGTSLMSSIGLLLSFNLGRSFLLLTKKNLLLKKEKLPEFLTLHYLLISIAIIMSFLFWFLNSHIKDIMDFNLFCTFVILIPFYLWSVNGSNIFATLDITYKQNIIIGIQRLALIIFVISALFFLLDSLIIFLVIYALILTSGSLSEIISLGRPSRSKIKDSSFGYYIIQSKDVHIDYLCFNLFPFFLILIGGLILSLSDLGRLNFIFQMINFIFIVSIVASLRIKTYISTKGSYESIKLIKKLFLITVITSSLFIFFLYIVLSSDLFKIYFPSFANLNIYFLISSLSVPGFIAYQFMYPILIEYNLIQLSMKSNFILIVFLMTLIYPVLNYYGLIGAVILFCIFYIVVLLLQLYFYKKLNNLNIDYKKVKFNL